MPTKVCSELFREAPDGSFGIIPIHVSDQRCHWPPCGWSFRDSFVEGDYEIFVYERTT